MTDHRDPDTTVIVGADGIPTGTIDLDQMATDATRLMYELVATAGDDADTDRVLADWVACYDPEYFGYLAAAAMSLMVRYVLAPTLDASAAVGLDLRPGLKSAAAAADAELGGGRR